MNSAWRGICFGSLLAIAAIATFFSPWGRKIEEDVGLALLFTIRGPRPAPDGVVIVNLDHATAAAPDLPENFSTWPRSIHARVVDRLVACGAGAITFDVHFSEARRPEDDHAFAAALRRAGNVILFEDLRRLPGPAHAGSTASGGVAVDTLVPPLPLFANAALALAPFPIPKRPVRINQTWLFKKSAGEVATMPAVTLAAMTRSQQERLRSAISGALPAAALAGMPTPGTLADSIRAGRELFAKHPDLASRLLADGNSGSDAGGSPEERQLLQALLRLYAGGDSIHINYYGPPATIPTLSYSDLLSAGEDDLVRLKERIGGRAVFIGAARTSWAGQKDGFYTVFSQPDGLDLSGVEIAATVYANLLEDSPVRRLSPLACTLLLAATGLAAGLVCTLCTPVTAGALLFVLTAGSVAFAVYGFAGHGIWPPLVIPLSLQLPAAFVIATVHHFLTASRERGNIRSALELYLPDHAVAELTKDLSFVANGDRMVYGACLLTDAQRYTALSEGLPPEELSRLMKEYYRHLFRPVTDFGGQVCNVIGDSMLAIWAAATPLFEPRSSACHAALQLLTEIDRFNGLHPASTLPTRVGLHYGYLLMGNIGAGSHFEYAPVGDVVNTASRIEGLNKLLGTRVLASEEVAHGVTGIAMRRLGAFLFAGKTQAISICQLLTADDLARTGSRVVDELFPQALYDFLHRRWPAAIAGFRECRTMSDDGPSRFYLQLSENFLAQPPPEEWQGVVEVGK